MTVPGMKEAMELVLLHGGAAALSRLRCRERTLVLAYHNVVPERTGTVGDPSLHLPRDRFAAQLDVLLRRCEVVTLTEVLASPPRTARPRVAITFDDAYRGAVELGVEELAVRGLPATFFVSPGLMGNGPFWWDVLAAGRSSGLPVSWWRHAMEELRGERDRVLAWAEEVEEGVARVPDFAYPAEESELSSATAVPGISVASHSWSHPNLPALEEGELRTELERPRIWLQDRFDAAIPFLAYPYGAHSPAVEEAARASGYRAALRIQGGWLRQPPGDPFRLPRYNVPAGLSRAGFELRLAGLLCG